MKKQILTLFTLIALTISVNAQSFYMGINNPAGACTTCHGDMVAAWSATGHAGAWDAGVASGHFGYSCIGCHTVGFDVNVVNGGADEFVTAGENDTYTITNEAKFELLKNVQCESCHGAKGTAAGTTDFSHMSDAKVNDYSSELCGQCHQGDHHPTYSDWQTSKHAVSKTTSIPGGTFAFIASDPNCSACHTAEGFIQFIESSDLEPNVTAPGDAGSSLTCTACHDPHNATNEGQLRMPKAELCAKCHNPEYEPTGVEPDGSAIHHSTAYMFDGKGGYEYEGVTYQNSIHTMAIPEKCVTCHAITLPYQSGDPVVPAYTGHSFEPKVEACVTCHADFDVAGGSFDYRGIQTEIAGMLEQLQTKLNEATPEDSLTQAFLRAKFNHDFVEADGSMGIHNTKYAKGLLQSALDNFTPSPNSVENKNTGVPTEFSLSQNYPNPFNPSTAIEFSLPVASEVKLIVFDALGNEITTLVNEKLSAGVYTTNWNAGNYSSGVYIYKLVTNNNVQSRKMILVK